MADLSFKISPNIILGSYVTARLGQLVKDWGTRYMLIVDPVLEEFGVIEKIKQSLTDRSVDFFVFSEIPSSPDTTVIEQALKLARESHIHGVITVGGTKVSNIGRAVCALCNEVNNIYDYIDGAAMLSGSLPLVCVLTTMKDIFLFRDETPIIDARSHQLKILKIQSGITKLAVFDPNLCVTLTENQIAATKIQTLCMAVETYISQKANFLSDTVTEKAIELLSASLDGSSALSSTTPPETLLAQGGCMASLASGFCFPGASTLLALTINARFKTTRSLIIAILFPYIIEDVAKFKTEKLAKVARLMHVVTDTTSDDVAVSALAENIRTKLAMFNLPTRLKDLGVGIEQLALAAEDAGNLDMINFLPRSMTSEDLFDLIKQAY